MTMPRAYLRHALLILGLALFAAAPAVFFHTSNAHAASACPAGWSPLQGYAWAGFLVPGSPNYISGPGWISFSGPTYQVYEDTNLTSPTAGQLCGYAWANPSSGSNPGPYYGWVSFTSSDLSGCPANANNPTCQPTVDPATGKVSGWARFMYANGSTYKGWISLRGSGTDVNTGQPFTYGFTQGANCSDWSGDGWGDTAVGWISADATKGSANAVKCSGPSLNVSCTVTSDSPSTIAGKGDTQTPFTWTANATGGNNSYTYA
ncbi:MAG: hypothetical protein ACYC6X_02775, partial [Minisyncoccota bacterium]